MSDNNRNVSITALTVFGFCYLLFGANSCESTRLKYEAEQKMKCIEMKGYWDRTNGACLIK